MFFIYRLPAFFFFTILLLTVLSGTLSAQVDNRIPFKHRVGQPAPESNLFHIRGDFTIIGNTNLTLLYYNDTSVNSHAEIVYVDVDQDDLTFNSSSATLQFSRENDANPACSEILYAGLYWSGRTALGQGMSFELTKGTIKGEPEKIEASTQIISDGDLLINSSYTLYVHHQYDELALLSPIYFLISEFGHDGVQFTFSSDGKVEYQIGEGEWLAVENLQVKTVSGVSTATFDPVTFSEGKLNITIDQLSRSTGTVYEDIVVKDHRMQVTSSGFFEPEFLNTQQFDKRKVKLKGPNAKTYTEITASGNSILFPHGELEEMYVGYADVTDYVKAQGGGEYTVANLALTEGWGDVTGLYGHWGLVVVYQNPEMDPRDVTIFDGYSYVKTLNMEEQVGEIEISGFGAVKQGPVDLKLGLMAGEGDRSITGDFLEIINQKGEWVSLQHPLNKPDNFFNSSIYTPVRNKDNKLVESHRNPRLLNNTGIDIVLWDIPNPNNSLIANEQTSTRFRFGTKQDVYAIYAFAFSVRSYSPDLTLTNQIKSINQEAPGEAPQVKPGQELTYQLEIKNKGKEASEQTQLVIPLPYTTEFVGAKTVPEGYGIVRFDPDRGQTGAIIWDIGDVPLPEDPQEVIAALEYTLKVTEDCFILANDNCEAIVSINGFVSGVGSHSGNIFTNLSFPQSNLEGNCLEEDAAGVWTVPITGRAEFARTRCAGYELFSGLGDISLPEFCQNDTPVDLLDLISPSQDSFNVYFFTAETGGSPLYSYYVNTSTPGTEQIWVSEGPAGSCTGFRVPIAITVTPLTPVPFVFNKSTCDKNNRHYEVAATGDYQLLFYPDDDPLSQPMATAPIADAEPGEYSVWVSQYKEGECESARVKVTVIMEDCPAVKVTITPDVDTFHAEGEMITYQLVVENVGKQPLENIAVYSALTDSSWELPALQPGEKKVFTTTYLINALDMIYKIVSNSLFAEGYNGDGVVAGDYQYVDVIGSTAGFFDFTVTTVDVNCQEGTDGLGLIRIDFKAPQTGGYHLLRNDGLFFFDNFTDQESVAVKVPPGEYSLAIYENPEFVHRVAEVYVVDANQVEFTVPEEIVGCTAYPYIPEAVTALDFRLEGPDGQLLSSETDGFYVLRQTGTYVLTGTDPAGIQCPVQKTFQATISQPSDLELEVLPFCSADPYTTIRLLNDAAGYSVKWYQVAADGETHLGEYDDVTMLTVQEEGEYAVTMTDSAGCIRSKGRVNVKRPLQISPQMDPLYTICPTNSNRTPLTAGSPFVATKWFLEGLEVSNSSSFLPDRAGSYSLIATDQNGCEFFADFEVEVKCAPTVRYPTAVRPGVADKLFVVYPDNLTQNLEVIIHNRWGEIIFHCTDNELEFGKSSTCIWDGTYNGKKIPNGNYLLTLRYEIKESGDVVTERGTITVLE